MHTADTADDRFDPGHHDDTCPHCHQNTTDYRAARHTGKITDYDDTPF